VVGHLIERVNMVGLHDKVLVCLVEPLEVAPLHIQGELLVLIYGPVTHLVHLVELALENDELTPLLRLPVNHASFKFLKSVYDFEEVTVVEEEAEVLSFSLLDYCLNGEKQCVLIEVGLEVCGSVRL
jgi:hypothetical protein